jgi:hypothetical protein
VSTEKKLSKLHDMLCDELTKRLKHGEEEVTKEGDVVKVAAKASTLNVIRQFLKDNDVQAVPVQDSALGELMKALPSDFMRL